MKPGIYPDIPAAEYHAAPGVSKSQLDLIARAPALLLWSRRAPVVDALEFQTAFHAMVLEPGRFGAEYVVAPPVDRRTREGKAEWAEFELAVQGRGLRILTDEDMDRLRLMRESLYAHPVARSLMTAEGETEASIWWTDAPTGELCRCRPDKLVRGRRVVVDLKSSDRIERFSASVADYRYHVQQAHYLAGVGDALGGDWTFLFIAVSTTLSAGRYPVHVYQLDPVAAELGERERRANLDSYASAKRSDRWPGVEILTLPRWATA